MTDPTIKSTLKEGPKTVAELATALGKSESTVRKELKPLVEAGTIHKDGTKYVSGKAPKPKAESKPKAASGQGRGRPKDPDVTKRDDEVLAVIAKAGKEGLTTSAVADALKVEASIAYISVWRLKKAGKIAKVLNGTRQPSYAKAAS